MKVPFSDAKLIFWIMKKIHIERPLYILDQYNTRVYEKVWPISKNVNWILQFKVGVFRVDLFISANFVIRSSNEKLLKSFYYTVKIFKSPKISKLFLHVILERSSLMSHFVRLSLKISFVHTTNENFSWLENRGQQLSFYFTFFYLFHFISLNSFSCILSNTGEEINPCFTLKIRLP